MKGTVLDEYAGHINAVQSGERELACFSVLVEHRSDGSASVTTFGLNDAGARERVSVISGTIVRLALLAQSLNAEASH